MTRLTTCLTLTAAFLAGGLFATPALGTAAAKPKQPGVLRVYGNDDAKLFTADGIKRAESAMANARFDHGLELTIDLYAKVPEGRTLPAEESAKAKFFRDWAVERATGDKAKGVYVLVCRSPGYVEVIADKTTRDRGFTNENEKHLRDTLINGFRAAKDKDEKEQFEIRDKALTEAVSFVSADLKDTTVSATTGATKKTEAANKPGGMGVGSWVCLGLCVLLGVWLVIGLIRAFTGGGGGGGPGGGGGGFGSSLLGGLFGAMAGMWLYNSMFGGGGMFGGSDAYAGDAGAGGDAGASGDGDFGGDTGAGGSFDGGGGGDFGGGDFGGDF